MLNIPMYIMCECGKNLEARTLQGINYIMVTPCSNCMSKAVVDDKEPKEELPEGEVWE